jgi:ligand-binding sensor domain-containing protein
MHTESSHRLRVAALSASLALAVAAPAASQVEWTNHIDPSMVNEMVHRDGILYMATFGGLLLYDVARGEFEQFDNVDGLPSNQLRCLVFDADDNLYIGMGDFGVAKMRFSGGAPVLVRSLNAQIDGLSSNTINSITQWGPDILYGANPGAGTIRNDFAAARYFERDGLPDDDVKDVLPDGDYAWIATNAGVAVLDRLGLIRRLTGAPTVANVLGSDGTRIWVGTNDGVWRFDPADSSWTDVGPDTRVMHGLYWDGTVMWGGAVRHFCRYTGTGQVWDQFPTGGITANYRFQSGGSLNEVRALATVDNGDLYLSSVQPTEQRGANLMRFDGVNQFNIVPNAPTGNDIKRLTVDVDGSVWAMFSLFYVGKLMPSGAWINYHPAIGGTEFPSNQYNNLAFLADSQGFKWFCSLPSPTLDQLDDRSDAIYSNDVWTRHAEGSGGGDGLGSLSLQRAVEDPGGNRWFLGDISRLGLNGWQGIHILSRDGTQWFEMTPIVESDMASGDIIDVAFGPGRAYIAHRTQGIQEWNFGGFSWSSITNTAGDQWTTPVARTSLDGNVAGIELRSDNVLWIATASGLFRHPSTQPPPREVDEFPVYIGIGSGILSPGVQDILLDHDENLWVATNLGLNKIARDDDGDIETYTTASTYATVLADLRYPLSVISPLSHSDCRALAMHPTQDIVYVGTLGGLSELDYTPPPAQETNLSRVYLYPNPVYRSRGQNELMIQNITGPVSVEVYNIEGVLVHSQTVDANGQVAWDLTTETGFVASSGSYVVRVSGPGGSVTKMIAVLR